MPPKGTASTAVLREDGALPTRLGDDVATRICGELLIFLDDIMNYVHTGYAMGTIDMLITLMLLPLLVLDFVPLLDVR